MSVKVLFFASLRERLGRSEMLLDSNSALSVREVWEQGSGEASLPANVLVSVNHVYADAETSVKPGDEVAFFPPVTGG
ncbi:MAG: MoaD/ThiS family protein [Gammaproteobacteria bacterium]|nr:MoaD/ThiS family protein [Gammaproteobacteria bacterium]MBU1725943.1 MoaD/ThiS family protein [Gammaproteobacteria bacterium]MBU2006351.1 MoaD/ThiS family protein [Gammaproteobacteria bacterium]